MSIPTSVPVVDETKKSKKRKIEDSEAVIEPKKFKKSKKDKEAVADSELFTIDVVGTVPEPKKDNAEFISPDLGADAKAEPQLVGKLKKTKRGKDEKKKEKAEEAARIVENAGGPPRPETENERMRREKKERKKEEKAARKAFKQANKQKPIDPVTITSFDGKDKSLTQCKKAIKKLKAHIKKQDDPSEGNLTVEAQLAQEAIDSIATLSEYLKKVPRVRAARLSEFELPKQRRDNAKNELDKVIDMAHGFDGHIRNIEKKLKPTQPKTLEVVEQLRELVKELKEMQADAQKEHETRAAEYRVADGRDPNAEKVRRQAKALAKREKKQAERLAKSAGDVAITNGTDAAPTQVEDGVIPLAVPALADIPAGASEENSDAMTGLHPARLAMLAREPSPVVDHRGSSHAYKKKIPGKRERKAIKAAKNGGKPPRRKRN